MSQRIARPVRTRAARAAATAAFLASAATLSNLACSSDSAQCHVGADCASGACDSTGRCVAAPPQGDAAPPVDAGLGEGAAGDAGIESGASDANVGCAPNHDGVIERAEVPLAAGLHATYRIAENVSVSTAGTTRADGTRSWDLSAALSGDHSVVLETAPIAGSWYAADFSGATYAAKLSDTSDLLGVFETTASALLLRGVVSPSGGSTRTELTYAPSVPTLSFPLKKGSSWQTNATASGVASGIGAVAGESYTSSVDAIGDLVTPFGTFAVQRVHVVLTRNVGGLFTVVRTYAFVAECFGPVATVVSQNNEANDDFTNAAEVRRLSP
jgi:hypothetical protein